MATLAAGLSLNNTAATVIGAGFSAIVPLTAGLIGHRVNVVTIDGVKYVFDYNMGGFDEATQEVGIGSTSTSGFDRDLHRIHLYLAN